MQVFTRDLIETHCAGLAWPKFLGSVQLGERFVVETERFNRVNGPIAIQSIRAGDPIAVHIESIEILPPFESPNGGPFFEGMGDPVELTYREGLFAFPNGMVLPAKPSVGNVAVLPAPTESILALSRRDLGPPTKTHRGWGWRGVVNDPRGKHCHQDCPSLGAGAILHLKAQVDQAGLCLADVHGYIGQGELAFAGIEVAARIQVRVEVSSGWHVGHQSARRIDRPGIRRRGAAGLPGDAQGRGDQDRRIDWRREPPGRRCPRHPELCSVRIGQFHPKRGQARGAGRSGSRSGGGAAQVGLPLKRRTLVALAVLHRQAHVSGCRIR
jgi:hypothetical protein